MPNVTLIYSTGLGAEPLYAARLLAFTKNTRLQMTPDGLEKFRAMSGDDLEAEMKYMAGTIPSSWEFVDVIFAVNDISRATAQQMTRTRTASFAMQSQRVTDMSEVNWNTPELPGSAIEDEFENAMCEAIAAYNRLVVMGAKLEDARGVLPIGINCNLIAKYNLRAFVDLVRSRDSLRVQGEYVDVVRQMKAQVLEVWPWSEAFFEPKEAKAIAMIEEVARWLGETERPSDAAAKIKLAKAADLLKK